MFLASCGGGGSSTGSDDDGGSPSNGYTISGSVKSTFTGKALSGATVTLKQGGSTVSTTTANATGSWSFANIASGDGYIVEASTTAAPNYLASAAPSFSLAANTANVDLQLERLWPTTTAGGELVAGTTNTAGTTGSEPDKLKSPIGLAFDADGKLYIGQFGFHIIRTVTPGNATISNYAGTALSGSANGSLEQATFNKPLALCFAPGGTLYIAEREGNRLRKVSGVPATVERIAGDQTGAFASSGDNGLATSAKLNWPSGLALDTDGNLYISDARNHRIRKIDTSKNITTIAGTGPGGSFAGENSAAITASFNGPRGLAFDTEGNLYITDTDNHRIRKIDATSGYVSTVAGGSSPGNAVDKLQSPCSMVVDAAGILYIADTMNHRIIMVKNGTPSLFMGGEGTAANQLNKPEGIALGPDGYLYVADTTNHRIMRY